MLLKELTKLEKFFNKSLNSSEISCRYGGASTVTMAMI